VADIDLEAVRASKGLGNGGCTRFADFPRGAARGAVEVAMLLGWEDVELLATIGGVAVTDQSEVLQHVQGPIHGRRDGRGVSRSAALDEVSSGDVAI